MSDEGRTPEDLDGYNKALHELTVSLAKTMIQLHPALMAKYKIDSGLIHYATAKAASMLVSSSLAQALGRDKAFASEIQSQFRQIIEKAREDNG